MYIERSLSFEDRRIRSEVGRMPQKLLKKLENILSTLVQKA
jgi:hypothetical protein